MNQIEFMNYLNKKMKLYNISEARLAKALSISQKSINRYRNGQTFPKEETLKKIIHYFDLISRKIIRPGAAYIPEEYLDLPEEYVDFDLDLKEEYEWETPIDLVEVFYNENDFASLCDNMKIFSYEAQEFILKNYFLIATMTRLEKNFIEKTHVLSEKSRKQLVEYMEKLPIIYEMIVACGKEQVGLLGECNTKFLSYWEFIKEEQEIPLALYENIAMASPKTKGELEESVRLRLKELYEESLYMQCLSSVPIDVFAGIDIIYNYTFEDWYLLFLLSKFSLYDNVNEFDSKFDLDIENEKVGLNEYGLWLYLEELIEKEQTVKAYQYKKRKYLKKVT